MRTLFLVIGTLALCVLVYWGITFYLTVQVSKKIIQATVPFKKESADTSAAVLVLGDSTAVGIGAARPEESVAGRVSEYLNATSVENYAKSGAVVADLEGQLAQAKLPHYRLILIQIGGNDIIRFRPAKKAGRELSDILAKLPAAEKVIVISAGDVGGATLFPPPVRPFYTKLNNEYHETFARVVSGLGFTYVNFGIAPETQVINERPDIYLAADGLHPSSAGYSLWFDAIKPSL